MKLDDIEQIQDLESKEHKEIRGGSATGIGALIQVTQMKFQFADEEALGDASEQRDLISAQQRRSKGKAPVSSKLSKSRWGFF